MLTTIYDLEKTINSGLATTVKKSETNFNQLFIYEWKIGALDWD